MKVLPEKVETKILLLILIICLSMSLLGARLMVMSQESLFLGEHTETLSRIARHHVQRIQDSFARSVDLAVIANEEIGTALLEARQARKAEEFRDEDAAASHLADSNVTAATTPAQQEAVARAMERVASIVREDFESLYVAIENEFVLTGFHSAHGVKTVPEVANLNAKYALAAPVRNPWQVPVWTSPQRDLETDAWVTTLLVPLYDGDEYLGFTGADYILNDLFNGAYDLAKTESLGAAYLFDSGGFVVTQRGYIADEEATTTPSTLSKELVQSIIRRYTTLSPQGIESLPIAFDEANIGNMAYIVPLETVDWKLLVALDTELVEARIIWHTWKLTLAAGCAALILVFLMRASFRHLFTHRIVDLERSARAFTERGIVDFSDAGNAGNDEIASLSNAFREMVESLANREAELTVRNQQLKNEISGRLSAVESLRESELKFRTLFDKSSDAVLVFDGKNLIDCNEAAVQMLKCGSKEELLKRRLHDFSPELQPDGTASSTFFQDMLDRAVTNGNVRYESVVRGASGSEFWVEAVITIVPYGSHDVFYMVWRDATSRKDKEQERIRLTMAIEQAAEAIIVTDPAGVMLYVNPSFELLTGCPRHEALGTVNSVLATSSEENSDIWASLERGEVWKGRMANARKDQTIYQAETTVSPVRDATGTVTNYVIVSYDVTKEANLETQLLQAQKMEAIGELASGIAHEINTPTQYIGDNIRFLQESFGDIRTLLKEFQGLLTRVKSGDPAEETARKIEALATEIELDYLADEIPIAIEQSLEGNTRIAEIVRAMKEFAHPGLEEKTAVDINHAIENTIAVTRNEWKYVADVVTEFDEDLPDVPCLPGAFNQVILNIIVNAAHAIGEIVKSNTDERGTITIRTAVVENWVEVQIQDTGPGIPENIRRKIFDPFFTTKDPGKGTGQGLALVHAVIVDKHEGTIDLETEIGKGTTFIIRLPLTQAVMSADQPKLIGIGAEE